MCRRHLFIYNTSILLDFYDSFFNFVFEVLTLFLKILGAVVVAW